MGTGWCGSQHHESGTPKTCLALEAILKQEGQGSRTWGKTDFLMTNSKAHRLGSKGKDTRIHECPS